jgi:uncharacterized membrane protein YeiH
MSILYYIDLIGVMGFAISGALTARDKNLVIFGMAAVAFITALGGGTIRDVLTGSTPVGWMNDLNYLMTITGGLLISILFGRFVQRLRNTFFLFDTIGIAVFTILGVQKALSLDLHPVIAVMMGMVSAVFGGVTRDIICNEIPLIFRKEIYALACLLGGTAFVIMKEFSLATQVNVLITVFMIITIRLLAVKFHWHLGLRLPEE